MTTLEKIHKELSERFKDEPNKNLILGYTMGVLEKHKADLVNEQIEIISSVLHPPTKQPIEERWEESGLLDGLKPMDESSPIIEVLKSNSDKPYTNCLDCPHHVVSADPDLDDWFNDDDQKVTCTKENDREITTACRPYNLRKESTTPDWCPLTK